MTTNEIKMINMIRENDNPELTLLTASNVLSAFLEQLDATPVLQVDALRESSERILIASSLPR